MRASDLLGPHGPMARAIDRYEHRPSQMAMADAVEDAIRDCEVLLVEAGTGTGKTWAYLVPALLSGQKVIVSTGTRNLQDQIMEQDVPLLLRHLDLDVDVACMKGLANYLCLRRYEQFRHSAESAHLGSDLHVLDEWKRTTSSGDRAELPLPEDAKIWHHVQSGSDTRIGAKCSHFEECFVTRMRREAERAQLVVVNHHLFFADLALRGPRGGAVLPDYDVVIFDEAHQIEDVATRFFGTQITSGMIERYARDTQRALTLIKDPTNLVEVARAASEAFFRALPHPPEERNAPLPRSVFTDELEQRFFALDDALEALGAHCHLKRSESESLGQLARRAGKLRDDLARITEGASGRSVAWIAKRGHGTAIGVSPIDVSKPLADQLFHRVDTVVCTSATLTTARDFDFIKNRLGLGVDATTMSLKSPFDWPSQAALYVPEHVPDPRSPNYLDVATKEILGLIAVTDGGAFVLCTSHRAVHELSQQCRPTLVERGYKLLVQGQAPKAVLLERFRERGDAILFATASFWEGVDVPGNALRLVIIDKLPFGVPSDPLVRARCEQLEEEGINAFTDHLVPAAALTLKQGFGRLIRSSTDRGIVAILDSRMVKKGYGRYFVDSLPDASRCYSLAETKAFWELGQ